MILSGISVGLESAVYSALLIGGAVYCAFLLGTGNPIIALFAVALAGTGLLTTVGVIVSMDTFGPVSDNAQGIAEMSGEVEGEAAQVLTKLDAVGNTTKAITKGIAIATAVLAATALFGAFRTQVTAELLLKHLGGFSLGIDAPNDLFGLIIGASVVFFFAGLLIMAVGRAAGQVVFEVREQFRNHPGIMDYTEKPEYGRVVDICTKDSLRELATPGLLAVLMPITVGFAFGYAPLGSYLAGAIAAGALMAVFLANSGGAWDNAKKLVEDGHSWRQGLARRTRPPIIGDTVGDPFKDTAGPAINPLIKVMNLVSLLIATSVVEYSKNLGLRAGVAIVAIAIVVGRDHHLQAPLDEHLGRWHRGQDPGGQGDRLIAGALQERLTAGGGSADPPPAPCCPGQPVSWLRLCLLLSAPSGAAPSAAGRWVACRTGTS